MILASEPPMKVRRPWNDFVHPADFMFYSDNHKSVPIWGEKYHMGGSRSIRKSSPLTSPQIRAGRALLRWSADDLARETGLGINTIRRAELAEDETSLTVVNDLAVRRALEMAGVEFIDENGGGAGVRFRQRRRPKAAKK
jgi:hypothetical protein